MTSSWSAVAFTNTKKGSITCYALPRPLPFFTRAMSERCSEFEEVRCHITPGLSRLVSRSNLRFEAAEDVDAVAVPQEVVDRFPNISGLKPLRGVASGGGEDAGSASPGKCPALSCVGVALVSTMPGPSGTHNVLLGIRKFLEGLGATRLLGIPKLARGTAVELKWEEICPYLNKGGSDLMPTIPLAKVTERMLKEIVAMCQQSQLDGLVFVSGTKEVLEIAKIAEHFSKIGSTTRIACVVHNAAGDLDLPRWLPTTLGFDSARSVLSEVIGNINLCRHIVNQVTYHFICCGSQALTLEVAMQTQPALCFISQDVAESGNTLDSILDEICDTIIARHQDGLFSGVIMVSDNFFGALAEMNQLKKELYRLRRDMTSVTNTTESAQQALPPALGAFFATLPPAVRNGLVFRADADGMPLLIHQEAERELGALVSKRLAERRARGDHCAPNFTHRPHNLRHVSVSPMPTQLDCDLGYTLGHVVGLILQHGLHGYVASVTDVLKPCEDWGVAAVPLARLMKVVVSDAGPSLEIRRHRLTPGHKLFDLWCRVKEDWRHRYSYRQVGTVQYWGKDRNSLAWASYFSRAEGADEATLKDLEEEARIDTNVHSYWAEAKHPKQFLCRQEKLMSPLQRQRIKYKPRMPSVFFDDVRFLEAPDRGRVCADMNLVNAAFPNLCRTNNLKDVTIMPAGDEEVSMLEMLPTALSDNRLDTKELPRNLSTSSLSKDGRMRPMRAATKESAVPSDLDVFLQAAAENEEAEQQQDDESCSVGIRIGITLLGRAGPGVNNVIQGLFDFVNQQDGTVVCIPMGIHGLTSGNGFELTEEILQPFRNQGGSDLLGQSRPSDLTTSHDEFEKCAATARKFRLDGLVIWGGRSTHSWTPRLAEYFVEHKVPANVIAVPASVQSDLPLVEQTLGFDTMCKTLSSVIGNLATQAASSGRIWYFVRIPGRSLSHIAAELALATQPHVVLTSTEEDGKSGKLGLSEETQMICDVVEARSREDKNYGVVLVPDQILTSVREMRQLFDEMAQICKVCPEALDSASEDFGPVLGLLTPLSRSWMQTFPERVKAQICALPFGDTSEPLDLGGLDTELIFQSLVETELTRRVLLKAYKGPFHSVTHSVAHHGRAAMPTNFDCDFGYTIGYAAGIFVDAGFTGLLVDVTKLKEDSANWEVNGASLCSFLTFTEQGSADKASYAIKPRTRLGYDHPGTARKNKRGHRINPGPAQFDGPCADAKTQSLSMPQLQRVRQMARMKQLIAELKTKASAGCPPEVLQAVKHLLRGGVHLIKQVSE
eukprot:TRINITY_DN38496_c0_g1_i1.p1 TRINITY_DN38496_c0_g1~~TRINITY_DN38496_c0_g1_i1.p1  ORF type:complete len:1287 (-),score=213.78 TRINITY_DN38496_c0_g1_i1:121-3981(-)